MSFLNNKKYFWIAVSSIGLLGLTGRIFHKYVMHKLSIHKVFYKIDIMLGLILFLVGFMLFLFERYKIYEKKGFFSSKINLFEGLLASFLLALLLGTMGFIAGKFLAERNLNKWSIGIVKASSEEPIFFNSSEVSNPVLTANDVTDIKAKFVADPFLILENRTYYMFFEVYNSITHHGDIALAISEGGLKWSYKQTVLNEPFHLSYPCVFKWKNEYYMCPETYKTKSIRLYKAENFPYRWVFTRVLLEGKAFMDNTIFQYDGKWWIFTQTGNNDVLCLYYSETPLGPWTEHPKSPVIEGDANIARPGGNVVVFDNRIIRYAQDDVPYYGNQLWGFEIIKLTTEDYEEKRIGNNPILKGFENWNARGIHHISPIRLSDYEWIASVDGH